MGWGGRGHLLETPSAFLLHLYSLSLFLFLSLSLSLSVYLPLSLYVFLSWLCSHSSTVLLSTAPLLLIILHEHHTDHSVFVSGCVYVCV